MKLLEGNAVKAVIATGGLTASNQGSYMELSGALDHIEQRYPLATGNPSDPDRVKLLDSTSIPALMIPC